MPRCSRSASAGQASAEYVAVLALVAVVLSGAATAVAAPEIPSKLVKTIRRGICIVAGDICTPADAEAAGLDPCVVSTWDRTRTSGFTIAMLHIGGHDTWTVMRRSDGTRRLSYAPGLSVGATVGAGASLGPRIKLDAHGSATGGFDFTAGKAWELPDEAALQRLIKRIDAGYARARTPWGKLGTPAAPIHFRAGGVAGDLSGEVSAGHATLADAGVSSRRALGRRTGPDGTTWYFDAGGTTGATIADEIPLLAGSARVLVEWHRGSPGSLEVRSTTVDGDRAVETVASLSLARPDDRRLVTRWALGQAAPPFLELTARDIARRLAARGTVQRLTYAQTSESEGFDASVKAGGGVGYARDELLVQRRLVAAEVVSGGGTRERLDCLDPL